MAKLNWKSAADTKHKGQHLEASESIELRVITNTREILPTKFCLQNFSHLLPQTEVSSNVKNSRGLLNPQLKKVICRTMLSPDKMFY